MKFLASAIATAALILSGLVAAPTASADHTYPGSVATRCSINVPNGRVGQNIRAALNVRVVGNARPAGNIKVYVFNRRGKVVKFRQVFYRAPQVRRISLGKFRKGRYTARMIFRPAGDDSVYRACRDQDRFRVRRR